MTARIIDGKLIAQKLREELAEKVKHLKHRYMVTPGLAVLLVGNNPASEVYVNNKIKACQEVGINSFEYRLPHDALQKHIIAKIEHLNNDPKVHGVLIQLPLPEHVDTEEVMEALSPEKDVDGFHVNNLGKLMTGQKDGFVACTPLGCLHLIKQVLPQLSGKKAVVIGRSNIVGKPMAQLLLQENCTVTMVHSKTRDITRETKEADILVAAIGSPLLVDRHWVKEGAVVIDVGINRVESEGRQILVGDVAFRDVRNIVSAITPVPGGVGPMTIAYLLANTFKAACIQRRIKEFL